MKVVEDFSINSLLNYKASNKKIGSLIIGSFSLFHIGHKKAISKMNNEDKNSAVIILKTKNSHLDAFNFLGFLEEERIKNVYVIEMIQSDYSISASRFVEIILNSFPSLTSITSGEDWRFGKNREGNCSLFSKKGLNSNVISFLQNNKGQKISSSTIWSHLLDASKFNEGLVDVVTKPYSKGIIIESNKQGRKLGFPTANINVENSFTPPKGIYFTKVMISGCNQVYNSITNVGYAPSINNNDILKHETHILNFNENIYGRTLTCYYYKRVEVEKKHATKEDLINFIKEIKNKAIVFYEKQN